MKNKLFKAKDRAIIFADLNFSILFLLISKKNNDFIIFNNY